MACTPTFGPDSASRRSCVRLARTYESSVATRNVAQSSAARRRERSRASSARSWDDDDDDADDIVSCASSSNTCWSLSSYDDSWSLCTHQIPTNVLCVGAAAEPAADALRVCFHRVCPAVHPHVPCQHGLAYRPVESIIQMLPWRHRRTQRGLKLSLIFF